MMSLFLLMLLLVGASAICPKQSDSKAEDQKTEVPTGNTPIFGVQARDNPNKTLIFFSSMPHFRKLGVATGIVFIRIPNIHIEVTESFKLDGTDANFQVRCISISYCFVVVELQASMIDGLLASRMKSLQASTKGKHFNPCEFHFAATLRGRAIGSGSSHEEICGPHRCPNMHTPANCHVVMINKVPGCKNTSKYLAWSGSQTGGAAACPYALLPEELWSFFPKTPRPTSHDLHVDDHHILVVVWTAVAAPAALVTVVVLVAASILVVVGVRRQSLTIQALTLSPDDANPVQRRVCLYSRPNGRNSYVYNCATSELNY